MIRNILFGLPALLLLFFTHNSTAQDAAPYDSTFFDTMEYRMVGPYRGGRSTAVAGHVSDPYTFYMGTTGGGVWRTNDAGQSWTNLSDGTFGGSIGAVAVADSDPNVIYVGTGSACIRGNTSMGRGAYRSTDGGKTWAFIGLPEAGQIGRIVVHPRDPDLVYVAALGHPFGKNEERGVYRSKDGGANWEKVHFVSDSTGAIDLAINPRNPREIYAAMWRAERKPWTILSGSADSGIYKSTDGGDTWNKLKGGLPKGPVGKIGVTVSPADPDRVWALVEAEEPEGGVYRSDNAGKSWTRVNRDRELRQRAYYYIHIYADPIDENTVYALNVGFHKSIDGGKTFERIGVPHGDTHDLWINPATPNLMAIADDGGVQVTVNGGESWTTYYNQPTAEFYSVTVDDAFPYRLYGPQQDNSTISVPSWSEGGVSPKQHWFSIGGCETGPIALHPDRPEIIYAGCYGGTISRHDRTTNDTRNVMVYPQLQLGQAAGDLRERFQWVSPIEVSPHDPDVVYHASQRVHRSADGGMTWTPISPDLTTNERLYQGPGGGPITREGTGVEVFTTVFALTPSPHERGTLWAGTDDGRLHLTRDEGTTWADVTPRALPDLGTVNSIEVSPHNPAEAFVAVHRYRMDDFAPYLFHTTDYGRSWNRLDGGLPEDHPVRVVREDPDRAGLLYAGTEYGMFISFDKGKTWQPFQRNLPVTPITDLQVHRQDLVVATQGRSFWIVDDLTPLHQLGEAVAEADVHLFAPRAAHRVSPSSGRGELWPDGPPAGAVLQYYLAEKPTETVVLEILNTQGEVLRRFSSDSTEIKNRERDQERRWMEDQRFEAERVLAEVANTERFERERYVWEEEGPIPAQEGMNKFAWNLRTSGVDQPQGLITWGFTGGVKVPPGRYQARLTVGDEVRTVPLDVRKDPRLEDVSQQDLDEQFALALEIRGTLNEVYKALTRLRSVREQVKSTATYAAKAGYGADLLGDAATLVDSLNAVEDALVQRRAETGQDVINYPPRLDNQIAYLYGYVAGPEGRPTAAAQERYDDVLAAWRALERRLEAALTSQLTAFNAALQQKGMPAVVGTE